MVPEIQSETDREFSVILSHFSPSTALPFNNPENKNFEKLKKASGDVIILHMRTKNHNHMMHIPEIWGGTDITFCYFGPFLPFYPTIDPQKLKLGKNVKKT